MTLGGALARWGPLAAIGGIVTHSDPAAATPRQVFAQTGLEWTFGAERPLGAWAGGRFSVTPLDTRFDVTPLEVGLEAEVRFPGLAAVSPGLFGRLGVVDQEFVSACCFLPQWGLGVRAGAVWQLDLSHPHASLGAELQYRVGVLRFTLAQHGRRPDHTPDGGTLGLGVALPSLEPPSVFVLD